MPSTISLCPYKGGMASGGWFPIFDENVLAFNIGLEDFR